jgi:hypothetical protein
MPLILLAVPWLSLVALLALLWSLQFWLWP